MGRRPGPGGRLSQGDSPHAADDALGRRPARQDRLEPERPDAGLGPTALNDARREQAAAVGAWVADDYDVDRATASDLLRARRTAGLALEEVGDVPVAHDDACANGTSASTRG